MTRVGSDELQDRWSEGWLPAINGIVHASGAIRWLEPASMAHSGPSLQSWPVRELDTEQEIHWISISECCELIDYRAGICIGCGETSYEGEGFVVVSDATTKQLRWAAVLQKHGPFINAARIDGLAWVINEDQDWFGFDLHDPRVIHGVCDHTLKLVPQSSSGGASISQES